MKQIIEVRSNMHYTQDDKSKTVNLNPHLELVIIHSDGFDYLLKSDKIAKVQKFTESRFIVDPESLQSLITDLQMHQRSMEMARKNADQLNALVKHVTEIQEEQK